MVRNVVAICAITLSLTLTSSVQAGGSDTVALTIYSTARPGAIPPEVYLPDMGSRYLPMQYRQLIPGYAIVKHERYVNMKSGRNYIKFPEIACCCFTSIMVVRSHRARSIQPGAILFTHLYR